MRTTHWLLVATLALGLACSRDEAREAASDARETARSAQEAAGEAASAAGRKADEMANAVSEEARKAEEAVRESAAAAAEAGEETVASAREAVDEAMGGDPVARCTALAAQKKWAEALEPCTEAHAKKPGDMAIEHALQQARAASTP